MLESIYNLNAIKRFPNIHLLKIYNSKIGNVQLLRAPPPTPQKKHTEKTKHTVHVHREEHNYIYNNKNRDDTINLLDNIFRLEIQRREEVEFYNDTWNHYYFTKYQRKKNQDKIAGQQKIQKKRV